MRRIVSIWLPRWPIDRLRKRPAPTSSAKSPRPEGSGHPDGPGCSGGAADGGAPFALTEAGAGGIRLYAVDRRASGEGLAAGMTLADARALLPALKTAPASPAADHRALLRLARWCGRYTPWVSCGAGGEAGDGEDSGITLDISGCGHLFGGEENLLHDLSARLSSFGIEHRLGCADTLGAAWAVARYGSPRHGPDRGPDRGPDCELWQNTLDVVMPGKILEKIGGLPVAALRLEEDIVALLIRLGLKTIGRLHGIPRLALMRRFPAGGPGKDSGRAASAAVLLRLDQALGKRDEPLSPLAPAPAFRTRMMFAEPLMEIRGLAHALGRLLADLAVVLEAEAMGARRLTLAAYRTDGTVSRIAIGTGRPSRDPDHLLFLFRERLEYIDFGYGIDLLILSAERVDPLAAAQRSMAGNGGGAGASPGGDGAGLVAPLVDRLANRLGAANVGRSTPRESHVPERAERRISALGAALNGFEALSGMPPGLPVGGGSRPFRLLGRPEPLEVVAEVPEGPPLTFRWRRMQIRVARAEGPERIAPEWWLADDGGGGSCDSHSLGGGCCGGAVRDYYRIEDTAGRRFWVYRDGLYRDAGRNGPPRWYIHGLFA